MNRRQKAGVLTGTRVALQLQGDGHINFRAFAITNIAAQVPINTFAADTILNANTSNTTESVNISRTYLKDRPELLMSKYIDKYKVNIKEYETNGGHVYESLLSKAFDNN